MGETLKQLRKERKLTQTELAEKLNTTQDTISLWELNKSTPDAENIVKLAKFFKVSTDFVLGVEDI